MSFPYMGSGVLGCPRYRGDRMDMPSTHIGWLRYDRGSSTSPSRRDSINLLRHLPTITAEQPSRAATALLSTPSAHANTIRDRNANACEDFARRDQRNSVSCSSSLNTNSVLGRPVRVMPHSAT